MKATIVAALLLASACAADAPPEESAETTGAAATPADTIPQDTTHVRFTVEGLEGPEAVRWDPDQRVWFVANFGEGGEDERDANGFISRVGADGDVDSLRFMVGTDDAPLHMPRGMFITGDTLWVADVDGVHGFDRRGGAHLAFVDFRSHEPGFLNDVAAAPGGPLHVTDTGSGRVYRIPAGGGAPEILVDSLPDPPNGITWSAEHQAFLLAPWGEGQVIRSLTPEGAVDSVAMVPAGRFDGIEVVGDGYLLATQVDSSLWLVRDGTPSRVVRTRGRPADIAYDPERGLVAVPYIALNRVDVWEVR